MKRFTTEQIDIAILYTMLVVFAIVGTLLYLYPVFRLWLGSIILYGLFIGMAIGAYVGIKQSIGNCGDDI